MTDLDARCFVKRGGALVPRDFMAEEMLEGIGEGKEVLVIVRKARNPRHLRLLFAMLRKITDNSDDWVDEENLLDDIKLSTGHAERRVNLITGQPYEAPRSIAVASMDQLRFKRWFDRAVHVLATKILHCLPEELEREILEMVDGKGR